MTHERITEDPDMQNATAALIRAAKRARQIAQQTGTAIVVVRQGRLVREKPDSVEQRPSAEESASNLQSGSD
jgi:hypothetical protein